MSIVDEVLMDDEVEMIVERMKKVKSFLRKSKEMSWKDWKVIKDIVSDDKMNDLEKFIRNRIDRKIRMREKKESEKND